ncbi:hypothetical protein HZS_5348 [Henneguya salminicola]|nr:hypothetical protein HZS_5348 [Henneguya salminicola]
MNRKQIEMFTGVEFVDSETVVFTNTKEGTLKALKYKISPRNRTNSSNEDGETKDYLLEDFLEEFEFQRIHENDLRNGFIMALRNVEILD